MKLYQDKNWLYQKYWGEGLCMLKIAHLCKHDEATIYYWMKKHGIKCRTKIGKDNANWKGGKIKKICEICNAIFEVKPDQIKKNWGIVCSNLCRHKLLSKKFKGKNNPNFGKHHSKKTKQKIGKASKRKIYSEETRRKKSQTMIKIWQNPEYIKKTLKATNRKPTNPEKMFNEMTPDIIRYTGNRAWWRKLDDGKNHNPDFKITGQNKVVEIFGDYWHRNDEPQELIDLYAQAGLECLVFWEKEIYENPEQIKEKVNNFISQ